MSPAKRREIVTLKNDRKEYLRTKQFQEAKREYEKDPEESLKVTTQMSDYTWNQLVYGAD